MPEIAEAAYRRLNSLSAKLHEERESAYAHWRELADYILPRRYKWLCSETEWSSFRTKSNSLIFDGTATQAVKTLASGLMNGITSPARPWFSLTAPSARFDYETRLWLENVSKLINFAMSESNFYNAQAVEYLDLSIFGTAATIIYEDPDDVFRCYNLATGEYYITQDEFNRVTRLARKFKWKLEQAASAFGKENLSEGQQLRLTTPAATRREDIEICHIIEPNDRTAADYGVPAIFPFREIYWEKGAQFRGTSFKILRARGFNEWPVAAPRWETLGNDPYGVSPSSDALSDIKQLQHMQKRKLQGMDKIISPPIVADIQLQHRPTALLPNGITYVAGANNIGAKPLYQVQLPLQEITADVRDLQLRIQEAFHVDLFRMISSLDTVRSATEIDARREEKLVLLGPVLDRIQRESLSTKIKRIYGIMFRAGLFGEPPEALQREVASIEYNSVLSDAQRAVGAAPLERMVGVIGNISGVVPEVIDIMDWDQAIRNYGEMVGVQPSNMRPPAGVEEIRAQRAQQQAQQEALAAAPVAAQSAKLLSETEVGGAGSALDQLLGA